MKRGNRDRDGEREELRDSCKCMLTGADEMCSV